MFNPIDIQKQLELYIEDVRPDPSIRHEIDIAYELDGKNVYLVEVRPEWRQPDVIIRMPYARATYILKYNHWKVYWSDAKAKWIPYKIRPKVKTLEQFLKLVNDDSYAVFKG